MYTLSSRSSSHSSTYSASSASSTLSPVRSRYDPYNLESRATRILTSLANSPSSTDLSSLRISPTVKVEHNDGSPVYSFQTYVSRFSDAVSRSPNFHLDVKEACVDEIQRKVWVRSEISGLPGGVIKESIDMLYFDEQGVLVGSIDHQKVKRRY